MARDISIAISAKDNFTQAITTMRNANQAFNKDLSGLQQRLDALNKTKVTLKIEMEKAKQALKEAEKQFLATGDAADKLRLELATADYENARRNFELVSKNARQAEKDILNLTNAISKAENRAGIGTGIGGQKSLLGTLASAGLTKMVGDALSGVANTMVSSAFGSEAGTMFSNILASAVTGAAMGSLAGPAGTVVGAVIGGITGAITGATKVYEARDDAFKEYYRSQFEAIQEEQKAALASGSEIAAAREQYRISFSTMLGGEEKADAFLQEALEFASRTPFEYDALVGVSKTMLAYGYKADEIISELTKIGDAGAALGWSPESINQVVVYLGRMRTTGKATLEYLNPIMERGVEVFDILAKASGKTKEEVVEMVNKGLVPGEEAAKAISDYLGAQYAGSMEEFAKTYPGLISTLQDAQNNLNAAMGKGYIDERKKGLEEEIAFYESDSGKQMQDAYKKIGQWKASLENLAEQYEREAMTAVMTGTVSSIFSDAARERLNELYEEYIQYASDPSEEAGAKMGRLLAEAQAIAQNEYNASEGAQLLLETNKTLADNLKNDAGLQKKYWDAGYEMGVQFSKGMASAINSSSLTQTQNDKVISGYYGAYASNVMKNRRSYAYGISYVPYDNYPAILHEGERVLTASENRNYGKSVPVVITGNNFYIREEADIDKIAREIVTQINRAYQLVD